MENQIQMLNQQHHSLMNEYQNIQVELNNLKTKYALETNLSTKERLLKKIKLLDKVALPRMDNEKLKTLTAKVEELKQIDQIKKLEMQKSIDQKYLEVLSSETKFTGIIIKVFILNPPQFYNSNNSPYNISFIALNSAPSQKVNAVLRK